MPDYTQSKIYKITSVHTEKCYIGSTTLSLKRRLMYHRSKSSNCTSKILFNLGECNIELIFDYPCTNKHELELIETYYIQKTNCVNCKFNRGSGKDQNRKYYGNNKEKNKEKNKERQRKYRENNKEKLKEQYKKYRENNKEVQRDYYEKNKINILIHNKQYRSNNKDKIKEYRENNKEKLKEQYKQYRSNNKEARKAYNKIYKENNKEYTKQYNHYRRSIFGQLCKLYNI